MTQIKEKTNPENLDADEDRTTEETALGELVNEEFNGVHVLGEEDMAKHFRRRDKDSDGDRDDRKSEG